MPGVAGPPRVQTRPLSAAERRWVDELQAVLARCPRRLELVTIGGADLDAILDRGLGRGQPCSGLAPSLFEELAALLRLGVAATYHEYEMGHEIRPEALRDLLTWMEDKVLQPVRLF